MEDTWNKSVLELTTCNQEVQDVTKQDVYKFAKDAYDKCSSKLSEMNDKAMETMDLEMQDVHDSEHEKYESARENGIRDIKEKFRSVGKM